MVTERTRLEEEQRHSQQTLLLHREQLPLGIIEWNREFKFLDFNPAAERIFGFKKEEVLNRHITETILPETARTAVEIIWKGLLENKGGTHSINENITKDERTILCEWHNTSLVDHDGHVVGVASVVEDITERKHAEDALYASEARFKILASTTFEGLVFTKKGQCLDVNRQMIELMGYGRNELLGMEFIEMVPEDEREQMRSNLLAEIEKPFETRILCKDNSSKFVEMHGRVMLIEDEKIIVTAVRDISQQKQQEEKIRRSQKMDALGKLTGGIAHDYNNMLNVIIGYSDLMKEKLRDNPKLEKYAREIHNAGLRNAQLTKKLLAFSSSQTLNENSVVNINSLLEAERHMLEKILTARIQLEMALEKNLWPVFLDAGDMVDAILNMSINAMHAIEGNGKFIFATCNKHIGSTSAERMGIEVGDYVLLSMTDTGSGMDAETKNKIFDPFFSTKGEKGTGLGLSQVYGFIQRASGSIEVFSEPGKGTQFYLYFPCYKVSNETASDKVYADAGIVTLQGNENILIVDDEPSLCDLTQEILNAKGYSVICAGDAAQAIKMLETEPVDLMLSDVVMPGKDGYQLAAEIQNKWPAVKIQLTSGCTDDRHFGRESSDLHQKILDKPYDSQVLLKRVRELLDNR